VQLVVFAGFKIKRLRSDGRKEIIPIIVCINIAVTGISDQRVGAVATGFHVLPTYLDIVVWQRTFAGILFTVGVRVDENGPMNSCNYPVAVRAKLGLYCSMHRYSHPLGGAPGRCP